MLYQLFIDSIIIQGERMETVPAYRYWLPEYSGCCLKSSVLVPMEATKVVALAKYILSTLTSVRR
jgi:hypothetical protein